MAALTSSGSRARGTKLRACTHNRPMSRARFTAALAAIALLALLGAEVARFSLWTTSDEPTHLAAAREWRYGPGMVSNFEHPVLMKLLAGISLPREKPAMEIDETRAGRAPMPFIFAGLALVTGLLARALAGNGAGLAAAALIAIEPTLRGHGTLVQSDVLVAFFLVAIALATLALVQLLAYAGTSDEAFREGLRGTFQGLPQERAVLGLARTLPKWIAGYGAGLLFVQGVAGPGERFNYFFGEVSGRGHALYFPVALGIKLTAAVVLASAAAFLIAGLGLFRGARLRRHLFGRAALPAALGGAYLAAACASNVNIGVRHALPAVPFLLVAAAGAGRTLLAHRPRAFRAALAGVVLLAAGESALRLGREISFGNFLVGGPTGIPAILSDSNVDWGQEQGQVFERVRRGDLGRVGLTTLIVDESGARAVGILGQVTGPDAGVDTVFFSRFLWDIARAMEKNSEPWPKFVWLRGGSQ